MAGQVEVKVTLAEFVVAPQRKTLVEVAQTIEQPEAPTTPPPSPPSPPRPAVPDAYLATINRGRGSHRRIRRPYE